jgi:hypothetical protein
MPSFAKTSQNSALNAHYGVKLEENYEEFEGRV